MIVIFTEKEKNLKARYQRGAIELLSGESIQLDFCSVIITNFSRSNKMYVVAANNKLNSSMKIKISDDEGNDGPTGLLN